MIDKELRNRSRVAIKGNRSKATATMLIALLILLTGCTTTNPQHMNDTTAPVNTTSTGVLGVQDPRNVPETETGTATTTQRDSRNEMNEDSSRNAQTADAKNGNATTADQLMEKLGIESLGVRLTAAGYLLKFQYRVLDPEKVKPWMDRKADVFLLDQTTGKKFFVPRSSKIGPLRQTTRKPLVGRTYFVMFKNTMRSVTTGNRVTVAVGEYALKNLTVQ